jgi:RimJ/RimL family protein N-acetyltransferase
MAFLPETERLRIRRYRDSDLEPLFAYRNDPKVAQYQAWGIPYPHERAIDWIANSDVIVPTEPGDRLGAAPELESPGEMIGLATLAVAVLQEEG